VQRVDSTPAKGDLLAILNDEQREAATARDSAVLVVAGPGSGKTRVITHRIAHAICNRGVVPERIVAVTFTNRAAHEMMQRVETLLGSRVAARIGTFHWLGQSILRRHAHGIGWSRNFRLLTPREARAELLAVRRAIEPEAVRPEPYLAAVSALKNGMPAAAAARQFGIGLEALERVLESYDHRLRQIGAMDLDDLLAKTVHLLRKHPEVQTRCAAAIAELLVDEYQDSNPVQQELLTLLRPSAGTLLAVGDEDQAIYGWRQAGSGTVRDFRERFPGARLVLLRTSYRCSRRILRAASALIAHNEDRVDKHLKSSQPAGERSVVYAAVDARDEAEWIVAEIGRLSSVVGSRLEEIGVLYRTNVQSRAIEEALVQRNIPYTVRSGPRFYELPEVRTLAAVLRLAADAGDDDAALVLLDRVAGVGKRRQAQMREMAMARDVSLRELIASPDLPVPRSTRTYLSSLDGQLREVEGRRRGPLDALVDSAIALASDMFPNRAVEEDDPLEEIRGIARQGDLRGLGVRDLIDRMTLSGGGDQGGGVSLLSLHSAKGLEFRAVFLAGVEEGLLPHRRSLESAATLEEERRLCYVGMTRARERLFLSYTHFRLLGAHASVGGASRFVAEILPANLALRSSRALTSKPRLLHVRPGQRVAHPRWRVGTVVRIEGHGRNTMVTIDFGARGVQRVQLCHAPLELLLPESSHVAAG
jgi:DNA helicase-2/ATP-dependent DNA helicase PcrA